LNYADAAAGYPPQNSDDIKQALNEAWAWLESQVYIATRPSDMGSDFVYITREGRKYLDAGDGEQLAVPRGLKIQQLTGVTAVLAAFPEWARLALASRCAARTLPLFLPSRTRPATKAKGDVLALDVCWKVAGLSALGRVVTAAGASAASAAAEEARRALDSEESAAADAAKIASWTAATVSSQRVADLAGLSEIVTAHELAFDRFARTTPAAAGTQWSATASLNADISVLERTVSNLGTPTEATVEGYFKRPLWHELPPSHQSLSPLMEPWRTRLLESRLLDLYNEYASIVWGTKEIDWRSVASDVNHWVLLHGGAAESQPQRLPSGRSGATADDVPSSDRHGETDHAHAADAYVESSVSEGRPSLRMLADVALSDDADDRLGFKAYAEALAGLIDSPETMTPLTLAINAPWGAGKTSLARMIERILKRKPAPGGERFHTTCWFRAWMHDDAPNLGSAFAAEVARTANDARSWWQSFWSPVPATLLPVSKRRWWLIPFLILLDVVLFALCLAENYSPALVSHLVVAVAAVFGVGTVAALAGPISALAPFADAVSKFIRHPKAAAATASMNDVSKQLGRLIDQATRNNSRFVIFVDDLERCRPPRAVDVLEVVNQLLDHEKVVTVVVGDMPEIAACAEIKYRELASRQATRDGKVGDARARGYGRAFIQKIVQLQFDLPLQSTLSIRALMENLATQAPRETNRRESALSLMWRRYATRLKSLWDRFVGTGVAGDRREIDGKIDQRMGSGERNLAFIEKEVMEDLKGAMPDTMLEDLVRERIQHRLSDDSEFMKEAQAEVMDYVEPLPRHAKRLLNRLRLLLFVAHERGMFGGNPALSPRHIGKWAVLCERWPELAQALSINPKIMAGLENVATHGATVRMAAPMYAGDAVLGQFFEPGNRTKLADVMERVVRCAPSDASGTTSTS
jgi:hypothetical protein